MTDARKPGHSKLVYDKTLRTIVTVQSETDARKIAEVEALAAEFHEIYLETAKRLGWPIRPENDVPFTELSFASAELDLALARHVLKKLAEAQDAARLEARDVIRAIIVREAEESTYEESRWDAEHLCDILDALTPEQLRKP